jgi:hypothetical protein
METHPASTNIPWSVRETIINDSHPRTWKGARVRQKRDGLSGRLAWEHHPRTEPPSWDAGRNEPWEVRSRIHCSSLPLSRRWPPSGINSGASDPSGRRWAAANSEPPAANLFLGVAAWMLRMSARPLAAGFGWAWPCLQDAILAGISEGVETRFGGKPKQLHLATYSSMFCNILAFGRGVTPQMNLMPGNCRPTSKDANPPRPRGQSGLD